MLRTPFESVVYTTEIWPSGHIGDFSDRTSGRNIGLCGLNTQIKCISDIAATGFRTNARSTTPEGYLQYTLRPLTGREVVPVFNYADSSIAGGNGINIVCTGVDNGSSSAKNDGGVSAIDSKRGTFG